jgi:hypothetical protein
MTVPLRAALYLRVSTARQAEHDVSRIRSRKAKRIASHAATSSSRPLLNRVRPPPMTHRSNPQDLTLPGASNPQDLVR